MFEILEMLVKDSALRKKVGRAARAYVLENFEVRKIAGEFAAFFDELTEKWTGQGRRLPFGR
jgi:hypothetical protein